MAGHSKWANIRHRKAQVDARKGKLFSKLTREILVAVREGGPDPEKNPRLRRAIERAKQANMPSESIERAIKKASGAAAEGQYEEVYYEAYAPFGVALYIRSLTDNRNRTVGEIKHLLNKNQGTLAEKNAVAWMFERKGFIAGERGQAEEEELFEAAVDAGAEDITFEGKSFEVITPPGDLDAVKQALQEAGAVLRQAEVTLLPKNKVPLDGEKAVKVLKLVEALEELDDVQEVYANFDIPGDVMERLLAHR